MTPHPTHEVTMTTHNPMPVAGYTPQSDEDLALVNVNKILEEKVLRQFDMLDEVFTDIDRRWLSIARTHIEQGFMAANRSIFRPQRIDGDLPRPE